MTARQCQACGELYDGDSSETFAICSDCRDDAESRTPERQADLRRQRERIARSYRRRDVD